jgi:hypothetical protein
VGGGDDSDGDGGSKKKGKGQGMQKRDGGSREAKKRQRPNNGSNDGDDSRDYSKPQACSQRQAVEGRKGAIHVVCHDLISLKPTIQIRIR